MIPDVSIIVPARNEARRIRACLEALLAQDYPAYEVVVVDDQSSDATVEQVLAIQARDPRVTLVHAGTLPDGWVGKSHALAVGTRVARGGWYLFVDADTHLAPHSLSTVLARAQAHGVDCLSLSPEQACEGFWERTVQPVVFEFLSARFDFEAVNDPGRPEAAANGQFILIRRAVYDRIGGHDAIKGIVLEDVALANRVKRGGYRLSFQDGRGLARSRMYESLPDLWQGWTKILFLLCGSRLTTVCAAACRAGLHALPLVLLPVAVRVGWTGSGPVTATIVGITLLLVAVVYARAWSTLRRLGFPSAISTLMYPLGCAIFVGMLAASATTGVITRRVSWRGRTYGISPSD